MLEDEVVIDRLEFGDRHARFEDSGGHHEHLDDVEVDEIIEFYYAEFEAFIEKIPWEMSCQLVDCRLELFG